MPRRSPSTAYGRGSSGKSHCTALRRSRSRSAVPEASLPASAPDSVLLLVIGTTMLARRTPGWLVESARRGRGLGAGERDVHLHRFSRPDDLDLDLVPRLVPVHDRGEV